jgi:hypothetical protein
MTAAALHPSLLLPALTPLTPVLQVGNEVTGTGLPETDMQAYQQGNMIPGAKYGRGG